MAQELTESLQRASFEPILLSTEWYLFQVYYVTCDGLSANRKFFKVSQNVGDPLSFPYKTVNPFSPDRELFFFCDAPHLLKTVRNCFSNSFAHSHSRMLKVNLYSGIKKQMSTCCTIHRKQESTLAGSTLKMSMKRIKLPRAWVYRCATSLPPSILF